MSKSTAVVRKGIVTVQKPVFTISKVDGKKTYALSGSFKTEVIQVAGGVGAALVQTNEQKIRTAINLVLAFEGYKKFYLEQDVKVGLPRFVKECIDPTVPHSTYGAQGSPERKEMNSHKVLVGIDYLIKKGNAGLKAIETRQKMIDAGVDVSDPKDVKDHNATARADKLAADLKQFCRCMVLFATVGVTENTIENLVVFVLRKKEKSGNEPNANGKKLVDAAVKAVFLAQGGKLTTPEPSATAAASDKLMDKLKSAAKKSAKSKK